MQILPRPESLQVLPMQSSSSLQWIGLRGLHWSCDIHSRSSTPPERVPCPLILDVVQADEQQEDWYCDVRCHEVSTIEGCEHTLPAIEEQKEEAGEGCESSARPLQMRAVRVGAGCTIEQDSSGV